MSRPAILRLIGLLLIIPGASGARIFGQGEAAGNRRAGQAAKPQPGASRIDFIVLVWYRRDDPLATFRHQVYDVRKGEYTAAVDAWIKEIRTKYPAYDVLMRAVDLSREAGQTEQLKVGAVIHRELLIAAARSGVLLGEPLKLSPGPSAGPSPAPRINRLPPLGGDRSFLNPTPTAPYYYPYYPVYPRLPL